MRIKSIRIQNFRSFQDETINLNRYSCLVGPNGAGKSAILAALAIFFQDKASSPTNVTNLIDEDYYRKNTATPIHITITFDDLNDEAKTELSDYFRQDELVVTAEAVFDAQLSAGVVKHYGQRLGMSEFRRFFDADKAGMKAPELSQVYDEIRGQFPELSNPRAKGDKADALRAYEAAHPEKCVLIPSEDSFYGVNSTGKLAKFIQWVFVPAVKDVSEEGEESKNSALGKLMARVVRSRTNFATELEALKTETLVKYMEVLGRNQAALDGLARSLQSRLEEWAHRSARLGLGWLTNSEKSVVLQSPIAGIKTGEGAFLGSLSRMGHGFQRSYLLSLLQELANSEAPNAPTLILGCEEPELYQHPPQARHLSDVLRKLATGNNQVLITTHSPLFVSGDGFEDVRLIKPPSDTRGSKVKSVSYVKLCERVRVATGEDPRLDHRGLLAKIIQSLQPGIAEMFFTRVPVLVEGLEDIAYITTELHLAGLWPEFRRLGCHLIPANNKNRLIEPIAISAELGLPIFVVYDSDGDVTRADHRAKHERDNRAILNLLNAPIVPFPTAHTWGSNYVVWQSNLTDAVKADYGDNYARLVEAARLQYAQEGGLEKNALFIAEWISSARQEGLLSATLGRLCESILSYARTV